MPTTDYLKLAIAFTLAAPLAIVCGVGLACGAFLIVVQSGILINQIACYLEAGLPLAV